jgi:hypothetical protein
MTTTNNTSPSHRSFIKGGTRRLGLRSRLVSAGVAAIATLGCTAAISAPAQAAVSHTSTACYGRSDGWSSVPFSATESATLCDIGNTSGYCVDPVVSWNIPLVARLFVHVTGHQAGCYHISNYGGAESMWANIEIKITDPLEPWNSVSGTVWLRIAVSHNGATHDQSGSSESVIDFLELVAGAV